MNASIAPIDFIKDIKVSTSIWMKSSNLFPAFKGWAVGYGSFTCSYKDIDRLIDYIKNQQEHLCALVQTFVSFVFSCKILKHKGSQSTAQRNTKGKTVF